MLAALTTVRVRHLESDVLPRLLDLTELSFIPVFGYTMVFDELILRRPY
jgi:hypothetical protein